MQLVLPLVCCSVKPEEIFLNVWREVAPAGAEADVQLAYRRYSNANSRIHWSHGRLEVVLSDVLKDAPPETIEALARILISKLLRRRVPVSAQQHYRFYLNRPEVRRQLAEARRSRGRKYIGEAQGAAYDLAGMFTVLNEKYFGGSLRRPQLGWSRQAARWMLGHYDPTHDAIVLSRILDRPSTPRLAVEYVLFHEMLHVLYPVEHRGARRCVHTPEFRQAEKRFEGLKEAKDALKRL